MLCSFFDSHLFESIYGLNTFGLYIFKLTAKIMLYPVMHTENGIGVAKAKQ